nr:hypothetical protein CFP56_46270 [Quercus suber]
MSTLCKQLSGMQSMYIGIPEKEEESYADWCNRMYRFLNEHDLWNIVETITEPTTDFHAWSRKNALALYLIRESCGSDRFSLIEKISKAEDAWDEIANPEGTDEPPNPENDATAFEAWSKKNDVALKVIGCECHNEFHDAIHKISSAKIAWDTLAAICALPKRTDDPPKAEKNDMALGLIEYSCFWFRAELDDKLWRFTSAKIVWDALAAICALPKNEKSIATVIECLESIPVVIKRLDDVDNHGDWSDKVKTYLTNQQL